MQLYELHHEMFSKTAESGICQRHILNEWITFGQNFRLTGTFPPADFGIFVTGVAYLSLYFLLCFNVLCFYVFLLYFVYDFIINKK